MSPRACEVYQWGYQVGLQSWGSSKRSLLSVQDNRHQGLKIEESGFFISTEYGFLGATPDGLVSCKCCGNGVIEIKCPFCQRDKDLTECMKNKNFCLESTPDGKHQLKGNHPYFYQVQVQLFCTGRSHCDFIVWTEKSIYVERITADERFMKGNLLKVKEFVTRCLIPEILSNWYSKSMDKCKGGKISRAD